MVPNTTDVYLTCRECESPFPVLDEHAYHLTNRDIICNRCAQSALTALSSQTTPDQELENNTYPCSMYPAGPQYETVGSSLENVTERLKNLVREKFHSHISSLDLPERQENSTPEVTSNEMEKNTPSVSCSYEDTKPLCEINGLTQEMMGVQMSHTGSSQASSSACSSSSVDSYEPTPDVSDVPISPENDLPTKLKNFINDKSGNMELHGLTRDDINNLVDEDPRFAVKIFRNIHQKITEYHTDHVRLDQKYHPGSESYGKYVAMIKLAANLKAVDAQIGWAAYYIVLGIEMGLIKVNNEDRRKTICEVLDKSRETSFTVHCKIARKELLTYIKTPNSTIPRTKYAPGYTLSRALPHHEQCFERAKSSTETAFNNSGYDPTADRPFQLIRTDDKSLSERKGLAQYDKLKFIIEIFEGKLSQEELYNLSIQARKGDPEAICLLLEFHAQDLHKRFPRINSLNVDLIAELKNKLVEAADQGHALACSLLGFYHLKGTLGFEKNKENAIKYLRKGSERDNPHACYLLALTLRDSDDFKIRREVKSLFEKAAKDGINCEQEVRLFEEEITWSDAWTGRKDPYQFFLS